MKGKIPFYNIINMFFVGAVFSIGAILMLRGRIHIDQEYLDVAHEWRTIVSVLLIIAMYEVGLIINRMGSIIIEPILSKTKIWPKGTYNIDVLEISEKNSKFQSMITELNLMRSHILIYLILFVFSIIEKRYWLTALFVVFVTIFIFGGKKHNTKINIIRKSYNEKHKEKGIVVVHKTDMDKLDSIN